MPTKADARTVNIRVSSAQLAAWQAAAARVHMCLSEWARDWLDDAAKQTFSPGPAKPNYGRPALCRRRSDSEPMLKPDGRLL